MDYKEKIKACVEKTKTYAGPIDMPIEFPSCDYPKNILYKVVSIDSVSAIFENHIGKTAVLNFASYKFPGGGFIYGGTAQEESLCRESFLYDVLKEQTEYYDENNKDLNSELYYDRALYSPEVTFKRGEVFAECDVITCAAPNFTAASNFVNRAKNDEVLEDRIKFVLQIAKLEQVDTLILGAFGCGVFKQDPRTVAYLFDKWAKRTFMTKKINIIFAIPQANNDNLSAFKKRFE